MFSSGEKMFSYPPRPVTMMDQRWKANTELPPNCPRCDSSNTKFCYYNNYSLTQPRYFCKGCRRYWTKGGSLRNVPVGGGCRKNRRGKSARLSNNRVTTGELNYSHRSQNSLRPDLVLDGLVGNSCQLNGSGDVPSMEVADGSTIDLAVLYAKFLNQTPEFDSGFVVPQLAGETDEPFELIGASNQHYQLPIQLSHQHGGLECQRPPNHPIPEAPLSNENQSSVGELNCLFESNNYEIQAFSGEEVGSDIFWSNSPIVPNLSWQSPKDQGFEESIAEDHMIPHQNPIIADSSAFDLSCFEAFYKS